jgi:hypothetical protein
MKYLKMSVYTGKKFTIGNLEERVWEGMKYLGHSMLMWIAGSHHS